MFVFLPVFPLTSPGTVHSGMASITELDQGIRRCFYSADDAALGHDCCLIEVRVFSIQNVFSIYNHCPLSIVLLRLEGEDLIDSNDSIVKIMRKIFFEKIEPRPSSTMV